MKRCVFLDRDGVINAAVVRDGKPHPPDSAAEMAILPGVAEALRRLGAAGLLRVVVTNQPDVARGKQTRAEVEAIHAKLAAELTVGGTSSAASGGVSGGTSGVLAEGGAPLLDAFYTCFHDDADHCDCRKPKPGLLLNAARDLGIDLPTSFMVGDRWRDIDAGLAAGCRGIFIDRGYSERKATGFAVSVGGLPEAVDWILEQLK